MQKIGMTIKQIDDDKSNMGITDSSKLIDYCPVNNNSVVQSNFEEYQKINYMI